MIQTFQTTLTKKEQLTHDVWLFTFDLVQPTDLHFKAGQYMILLVPQADGNKARRLYSISSVDSRRTSFEMVVEFVPNGIGSTYLNNLKEKEEVQFQGPAGLFSLKESPNNKIFLATGTGIAPITSIIESTVPFMQGVEYYLFWGIPTMKDLYFFDKLKKLEAQYPHFHFFICPSREPSLESISEEDQKNYILGRVNVGFEKIFNSEPKENILKPISEYDFYICGGKNVVDSLRTYLETKQIPKDRIHFEKFV